MRSKNKRRRRAHASFSDEDLFNDYYEMEPPTPQDDDSEELDDVEEWDDGGDDDVEEWDDGGDDELLTEPARGRRMMLRKVNAHPVERQAPSRLRAVRRVEPPAPAQRPRRLVPVDVRRPRRLVPVDVRRPNVVVVPVHHEATTSANIAPVPVPLGARLVYAPLSHHATGKRRRLKHVKRVY